MANVPKAITDLPVASAMGDDDLLVVSQNATTSSIKGELIKGYAQNAVASQVTAAQTAANQAGQSATQAEAARQGAAAAQTAAENAQDAAETARDQSVAAAGTIGDSVEQAQTAAGQASSAKDAAVAAQSAAEAAKTAAETASGQAQTAATQATGSATAAQTAATQAGDAKTDAETARNEAETSAAAASNSATDAESAAAEAEQAKTYIENMDMEGETLPAGSSVTVTKTTSPEGNLLFVIGVPQGIQGDKGDTGETGATGPQGVSVTNATVNEDGDLVITLSAGDPINAGPVIGPQGIQGEVGPTGASVDRIERTSGTGAPGTTDTYTVYLTNGQTGGTFQVYNGSNGTGSGDFMADGSVPMAGDLQMGGHAVTGMADGTDPTDGATVGQLSGKLDSPDGGTAGQVLTKTADGSAWEDAPSGLPDGGTEGQMLYKSADGVTWGDKPVMWVKVTETGNAADKTLSEIYQAYQNGYVVYCDIVNWGVLPLSSIDSNRAVFFSTYHGGSDPDNIVGINADVVVIRNSGVSVTTDFDLSSIFLEIPSGGTTGQVLTKTSTGEEWSDAPSGLPEGGTEGQVIKKGASGAEWSNPVGRADGTGEIFNDYENNTASGNYAHAEGRFSHADGTCAHSEGISSRASGDYSHSEGYSNTASGGRSHAEGYSTTASAVDSHSEGRGTIANGAQQHVQGRYNVSDHRYAHIVGNGSDASARSNAHTLDWDGNAWFAGDVFVGGSSQTSGEKLMKEPTGTQGQLLGFTADNTVGAVDAPESGLTQEQADERYLQLTGGTIEVDALSTALTLKNTKSTGAVSDVNRSPFLNFETGNGKVVNEYIDFGSGRAAVAFYDVENDDFVAITGLLDPVDGADAANKAYVDSKAPTSVTVTLTTSGWSSNTQTVTVSGVSATETAQLITPTPAIASQSAYYEAGIMCTGQAANSLTFTCQTVPTSNLTVYVVIQPLN